MSFFRSLFQGVKSKISNATATTTDPDNADEEAALLPGFQTNPLARGVSYDTAKDFSSSSVPMPKFLRAASAGTPTQLQYRPGKGRVFDMSLKRMRSYVDGYVNLGAPVPTFVCNICMSNCDLLDLYCLKGNGGCAHRFCTDCVEGWLTVRIGEGEIENPCPLSGTNPEGCPADAGRQDVVNVCGPEIVEKYERFKRLKGPGGDRLVECPQCKGLIEQVAPAVLAWWPVAADALVDVFVLGFFSFVVLIVRRLS